MTLVEELATRFCYNLVDIGANLTNKCFSSDLGSVINRATECGVKKILVTGTCERSSSDSLKLALNYPTRLFSTSGVHPHHAKHFNENSLVRLRDLAMAPECVAIGECGLDFNRNFSRQEDQLRAFEQQVICLYSSGQVGLACELGKPLFIHERDAHQALLSVLSKFESRLPCVVIHCFTGTVTEAETYISRGYYIGLTGFLWKDKLENGVQHALRDRVIPVDRLLLETDAPYMFPNVKYKKLPVEVQEKLSENAKHFVSKFCFFDRNEPCSLPVTCELIAAFMNIPPEQVAQQTTKNAISVFGLPGS